MNLETIVIMFLSYSLGAFTIWIKRKCEKESEESSTLPQNCPYVNK